MAKRTLLANAERSSAAGKTRHRMNSVGSSHGTNGNSQALYCAERGCGGGEVGFLSASLSSYARVRSVMRSSIYG
jgi:hypothetical protein